MISLSCTTYIISIPTPFYGSKIDPLVYPEFRLIPTSPLLLINPQYLKYTLVGLN